MLRRGFDELAPREREILRLRFFEGLTQREIADEVGISQMHVSRLIRRSVDALRDTHRRADGHRRVRPPARRGYLGAWPTASAPRSPTAATRSRSASTGR